MPEPRTSCTGAAREGAAAVELVPAGHAVGAFGLVLAPARPSHPAAARRAPAATRGRTGAP